MMATTSWDKIRLKHAAKQYKRGPGPTGADRLARRVTRLLLAAHRLARRTTDDPDRQWAERLIQALGGVAPRPRD
jgi:hypothetical protein